MDNTLLLLERINALQERVSSLERQEQIIGSVGGLSSKTTPAAADQLYLLDSAASNAVKIATIAQVFNNTQVDTTWTPTLRFGGGNTGMTGTFNGLYLKVGRAVMIGGYIVLTSKGSSTGNAIITLPFTTNGSTTGYMPGYWFGMGAAYIHVGIYCSAGTSNGLVVGMTAGSASGPTQLTDAAFTNTSQIQFSGVFFTT